MSVTVEELRDDAVRQADEARDGFDVNWAADRLFFVAFHAVCRELGKVPTHYVDNHDALVRELGAEGRTILAEQLAKLEQLRVRAVEYPPEDLGREDLDVARRAVDVIAEDLGLGWAPVGPG